LDFGSKKLLIGLSVVAALAGAVVAGVVVYPLAHRSQAVAAAPATIQPQPGWVAPSPQFLADWDAYRDLMQQLRKEQDNLQRSNAVKQYQADLDRSNGLVNRLQQSVPQGFSFDPEKRFFIPAPKPAPADPSLGESAKPVPTK